MRIRGSPLIRDRYLQTAELRAFSKELDARIKERGFPRCNVIPLDQQTLPYSYYINRRHFDEDDNILYDPRLILMAIAVSCIAMGAFTAFITKQH